MKQQSQRANLSIIIVNWNGKKDTLACLSSLKTLDTSDVGLSVIVVDNGSTDDSVDVISKIHPWVTLLKTGRNLGFTGGNNFGVAYAIKHKAEYIWFLNNDTVVDKNALSFMSAFDDPSVGACGSKIYFSPGHEFHIDRYSEKQRGKVIWYGGGIVDWENVYASHRGVDQVDSGQFDTPSETDFITGCSFVIRTDIIRKIGAFDDRFYLYLEDLDLSLRIQRSGWKTMYVPQSVLWHVNAGSSGRPGNPLHEYYFTRNRLLIGFRYASLRTKLALLRESVRFIFGKSSIRRKAVCDAFLCRYGRQYEQK